MRKFYLLVGRLRNAERVKDLRTWQIINFSVNSQIKDVDKRIKPGEVFPSLASLDSDSHSTVDDDYTPTSDELRQSFAAMIVGLQGSK